MASIKKKLFSGNQKGAPAKQLIIKTRGRKTFSSKLPDMSNAGASQHQRRARSKFSRAVAFAQTIIRDPMKKAAYQVRKGETVYHRAIKDYLKSKN